MITDGASFVAVGSDPSTRAAWTSPNGLDWDMATVPDPAPASDCRPEPGDLNCLVNSASMDHLARLGDTLYAIGTSEFFNDYGRPVGWYLTDGGTWQAIQSESEFFASGFLMDLTASETSLLAIKLGPAPFFSNSWRWTFETSWVATDLAGTNGLPIELIDATWGHGRYLAVGVSAVPVPEVGSTEWETSPMMWSSEDGLAWAPIDRPPGAADLCSVTATTDGFVALGTTTTGLAIWASNDAASWTRSDFPPPGAAVPPMHDLFGSCGVTELENGLLLATRGIGGNTLTWTSSDGDSWDAGPTLDVNATPDQVAALGGTVVLFGDRGELSPSNEPTPVLLVGIVEPP